MEIQVESLKRCELVKISGQVDSSTAPEFQHQLLELIDGGAKYLVISLGGVSFMSSAGLTALLRARIRLRKRIPPGDVVLAGMSPKLKETFELVGMNYIFQFYDTEVEAVGAC
jgi:anti-sigma B factor antagonist